MKYPYPIGTLCSAICSFVISSANAELVTVTFDSLEMNDSGTYNMSSYTEAGLTFTGFVGLGVDRIEITAQSGNPAYLQIDNLVFEPSAVPVPAAIWLSGSGLLGLVGISRRNKAV